MMENLLHKLSSECEQIDNSRSENFPIKISLVVSDNKNAKGILHAKKIRFLI